MCACLCMCVRVCVCVQVLVQVRLCAYASHGRARGPRTYEFMGVRIQCLLLQPFRLRRALRRLLLPTGRGHHQLLRRACVCGSRSAMCECGSRSAMCECGSRSATRVRTSWQASQTTAPKSIPSRRASSSCAKATPVRVRCEFIMRQGDAGACAVRVHHAPRRRRCVCSASSSCAKATPVRVQCARWGVWGLWVVGNT